MSYCSPITLNPRSYAFLTVIVPFYQSVQQSQPNSSPFQPVNNHSHRIISPNPISTSNRTTYADYNLIFSRLSILSLIIIFNTHPPHKSMFILLQVKDTIRIPPDDAHLLQQDPLHVMRVQLNNKYANKVIPDVGLCALVHSILSYDDPTLFPSDPGPYVRCTFRLVVFQPQEGEILKATIESSNPQGIVLSIGFFSHIIVEPSSLAANSSWDETEKVWVWDSDGAKYHYDHSMPVRLRILRTVFNSSLTSDQQSSIQPTSQSLTSSTSTTSSNQNNENLPLKSLKHGYTRPPLAVTSAPIRPQIGGVGAAAMTQEESQRQYTPPFMVFGSMLDHGLGPIEWWD